MEEGDEIQCSIDTKRERRGVLETGERGEEEERETNRSNPTESFLRS